MKNSDLTPIIAGTLSVQMCLKFCQLSSLDSKKEFTRTLTLAPVALASFSSCGRVSMTQVIQNKKYCIVVADSVLLNKNSSFIYLSFSYWVKAIKWLSKALSVGSSSRRLARSVLCLILEQTCWHTLAAMLSIYRKIMSLESETSWFFFFAPDSVIISIIFSAHGLISSLAIVCGFLQFAIQYAIS